MRTRDYELIAASLKENAPCDGPNESRYQWASDCVALADAFKAAHPAFDRQRFLNNCGVIENAK